jgi:integrase
MNDTTILAESLTKLADSNNMTLGEMAQQITMIIENKNILALHRIPISQSQTDKRWRTRLPDGRQIVKTRREDLEASLIKYYKDALLTQVPATSVCDRSLTTIYPEWLEMRKKAVCQSTLADDIRNWQRYIADSNISDIPLTQLTKAILKQWTNSLLTEHHMTKKYFGNIRILLNSMLDYAADAEYIEQNKFRDIRPNNNLFKIKALKAENEEVFTAQEQRMVMQEAERDSEEKNSAIPLGICLLFLTGLRVGELCALRYGDIVGNYLYVRRMLVENITETKDGLKSNGYKIVDHAKSSAGNRKLYLTSEAHKYLERIRELNRQNGFATTPDSLIFQREAGICNQRVFDSRIKKYCSPKHLNLPFAKSCHDIRRTYITHLFNSKLDNDTIRRIAGHNNIEMTLKYCRGRESQEEIAEILEDILKQEV